MITPTTDEALLIEQVSETSATSEDGHHLVHMYYPDLIRSTADSGPARRALWQVDKGEWVHDLEPTCGQQDCILPDHTRPLDKDEADLVLVQSHNTVTLAELYRKGKSRGLLTARTEYGG
jgi:hypothetical protein